MSHRKQARISLRKKLVERDLSIKQLAAAIGRPRETVSRAIHHGRYPRVLQQIHAQLSALRPETSQNEPQ